MSFAETFAGTLAYASKQLDDNYEGPHTRRPITFPPADLKLPNIPSVTEVPSGTLTVGLKSIRAPKFSVEYTVPASDSVYSLKERLLTDPTGPIPADDGAKYGASSIKLLIKSKVISDTRQLAELPSTSFIVMFAHQTESNDLHIPMPSQLYWGDEAELIDTSGSAPTEPETVSSAKAEPELPGVNDKFWSEVENIAKRYVADPKALVETLKTAVPKNDFDLD